jgi:hypothetical protein
MDGDLQKLNTVLKQCQAASGFSVPLEQETQINAWSGLEETTEKITLGSGKVPFSLEIEPAFVSPFTLEIDTKIRGICPLLNNVTRAA